METSTMMLYQATRDLSPEQYAKLRTWWTARQSRGGNRPAREVVLYGGKEWWKDDGVKRELVLTDELAARIEEQYQRRQQIAAPLIAELQKATDALNTAIGVRELRASAITAQLLQVEALRSRINESRTVMLYRFYRLLTPEQYQKFRALVDRERGRGRGGRP
jgi:Spy/CpxP family protein refolding chaperone